MRRKETLKASDMRWRVLRVAALDLARSFFAFCAMTIDGGMGLTWLM